MATQRKYAILFDKAKKCKAEEDKIQGALLEAAEWLPRLMEDNATASDDKAESVISFCELALSVGETRLAINTMEDLLINQYTIQALQTSTPAPYGVPPNIFKKLKKETATRAFVLKITLVMADGSKAVSLFISSDHDLIISDVERGYS